MIQYVWIMVLHTARDGKTLITLPHLKVNNKSYTGEEKALDPVQRVPLSSLLFFF